MFIKLLLLSGFIMVLLAKGVGTNLSFGGGRAAVIKPLLNALAAHALWATKFSWSKSYVFYFVLFTE
jgi:hypothetical protein